MSFLNDEVPYSKREQDEYRRDVIQRLDRIENQTIQTNGKVAELQKWRYFITGGMSVLTLILLPILTWALYTLVTLHHA